MAGWSSYGKNFFFREEKGNTDDTRKEKCWKKRKKIAPKHPRMVKRNIWIEKIQKRWKCYGHRKERHETSFFDDDEYTEKPHGKECEESIEKEDGSERKRCLDHLHTIGDISLLRLTEKLQECLANHFIIGKIDEKIPQKKEPENNTRKNKAFKGGTFPKRYGVRTEKK